MAAEVAGFIGSGLRLRDGSWDRLLDGRGARTTDAPGNPALSQFQAWELDLLGRVRDREATEQLGRSYVAVKMKRRQLRRPHTQEPTHVATAAASKRSPAGLVPAMPNEAS
jgi:hypothetical protein